MIYKYLPRTEEQAIDLAIFAKRLDLRPVELITEIEEDRKAGHNIVIVDGCIYLDEPAECCGIAEALARVEDAVMLQAEALEALAAAINENF